MSIESPPFNDLDIIPEVESPLCDVCGHLKHKSNECDFQTIEKGCLCGSCRVMCGCDAKNKWFLGSMNVNDNGDLYWIISEGPFTDPKGIK